jgi:hypothetical protein
VISDYDERSAFLESLQASDFLRGRAIIGYMLGGERAYLTVYFRGSNMVQISEAVEAAIHEAIGSYGDDNNYLDIWGTGIRLYLLKYPASAARPPVGPPPRLAPPFMVHHLAVSRRIRGRPRPPGRRFGPVLPASMRERSGMLRALTRASGVRALSDGTAGRVPGQRYPPTAAGRASAWARHREASRRHQIARAARFRARAEALAERDRVADERLRALERAAEVRERASFERDRSAALGELMRMRVGRDRSDALEELKRMRGGCRLQKAQNSPHTFPCVKVVYPKCKEGWCGPVAIQYYIKKVLNDLYKADRKIKSAWTNLKQIETRIYDVSREAATEFREHPRLGLSVDILAGLCQLSGFNLEVHNFRSLHGFTEPIKVDFGFTIVVPIYLEPDEKHFGAIIPRNKCSQCNHEIMVGKAHNCPWRCEDCGLSLRCAKNSHRCTVAAARQLQRGEYDNGDLARARGIAERVQKVLRGEFSSVDEATMEAFYQAFDEDYNLLLMGEAGCGKTTAISTLVRKVVEEKCMFLPEEVLIVAFQGVATTQYVKLKHDLGVEAKTIDSVIGSTKGNRSNHSRSKAMYNRIEEMRKVKLLIIDEISSVSHNLWDKLEKFSRKAHALDDTFGGVQVICVGDFGQSPPVACKKGESVIDHHTWHALDLRCFTLLQQKRLETEEENLRYLQCLMETYRGLITAEAITTYNSNRFDPSTMKFADFHHLVAKNKQVYTMNDRVVQECKEAIMTYPVVWTMNKRGKRHPTEPQTRDMLSSKEMAEIDAPLRVWVGARVMFTDNHYLREHGVANGSYAHVVSTLADKDGFMVETESGHRFEVTRRPLDGDTLQFAKHFSVKLGYASTTYKIQGRTLGRVCIWPDSKRAGSNQSGMMNMCLSRVRRAADLFIGDERELQAHHFSVNSRLIYYMEEASKNSIERNVRAKVAICHQPSYMIVSLDDSRNLTSRSLKLKDRNLGQRDRRVVQSKPLEYRLQGDEWKPDGNYMHLFSNVILYDYETWNKMEACEVSRCRPYGVYARYWPPIKSDELPQAHLDFNRGVNANGVEKIDLDLLFWRWIAAIIKRSVHSYHRKEEAYKKLKNKKGVPRPQISPIILVAYNGSKFDHILFTESTIRLGLPHDIHPTIAGQSSGLMWEWCAMKSAGQIVTAMLKYDDPVSGRVLNVLKTWDPVLWIPMTLEKAYQNFGNGNLGGGGKGVFPHFYASDKGEDAFLPGEQVVPLSGFPDQDKVRAMANRGRFKWHEDGVSVLFDVNTEYRKYVRHDVELLQAVMDGMQHTVFYDILPNHPFRITSIATVASFSLYCFFWTSPKKFLVPNPDKSKRNSEILSVLQRPSHELGQWIRRGIYGGCAMVRRHKARASFSGEERTWANTNKDEAVAYIDANGLYHGELMNRNLPFGRTVVLTIDCKEFIDDWLKSILEGSDTFPMFMAELDVYPNTANVEPFLPEREGPKTKLMWDCTPKIQQVYTCVDLETAVRQGARVENCTKVAVWGEYKDGRWTAQKDKLFEPCARAYLNGRLSASKEGKPGKKQLNKLCANSLYGGISMRDQRKQFKSWYLDEYSESIADNVLQVYATEESLHLPCHSIIPIGERKVERDEFEVDGDQVIVEIDHGPAWMFAQFDVDIQPGEHCGRCPYIGAFILAYSRQTMSKAIDALMGPDRYSKRGLTMRGIYYTDTDSIFVTYSLLKHLVPLMHRQTLGCFSDDLEDDWIAGDEGVKHHFKAKEEKGDWLYDIDPDTGLPLCALIYEFDAIAKKMYSGKFVCPYTNKCYSMKTKAKGVPRKGHIITGVQYDVWWADAECDLRDEGYWWGAKQDGDDPTKRLTLHDKDVRVRSVLNRRMLTLPEEKFDHEMIKNAGDTLGVVVARNGLARTGLVSRAEERPMMSIRAATLTRRVAKTGNTLSPDRIPLAENIDFSMPRGWTDPSIVNDEKKE